MKTTFAPIAGWSLPWFASLIAAIAIVYFMTATVLKADVPSATLEMPSAAYACDARQDDPMFVYAVTTNRLPVGAVNYCFGAAPPAS